MKICSHVYVAKKEMNREVICVEKKYKKKKRNKKIKQNNSEN